MFDAMIAIGLALYLVSLAASLWILGMGSRYNFRRGALKTLLLPIYFLLVETLYVLPLSIRTMFTTSVEGDISPQVGLFVDYIPICLVMCAFFNISMAIFYHARIYRPVVDRFIKARPMNLRQLGVFGILLLICLVMLSLLGRHVGGIANLILVGYKVNEILAGATYYAVAFDWLTALCVALLFSAFISRSRTQLFMAFLMLALLSLAYFLMARRGSLTVLLISALFSYHFAYKKLSLIKTAAVVSTMFFLMNFIGLIRGESYRDIASVTSTIAAQNARLEESDPGMFYVLTTGNFAVPFETMPQVVRTIGKEYTPGFGAYSLRSFTLIIPTVIWPDRPDGLSVWYMETFYGARSKHEGRQFFFLSEAFMNFGPFGMIIWGALTAWTLRLLAFLMTRHRSDALIGALVATFLGSFLNLVANDFFGFYISFMKGLALPILVLLLFRKLFDKRGISARHDLPVSSLVPVQAWRLIYDSGK
jgi:oligosaccharide repeat unit polymerase